MISWRRYFFALVVLILSPVFAENSSTIWAKYQRMVNVSDQLLATHRKTLKPPIEDDRINIGFLKFHFVDLHETEERLTLVLDAFVTWQYKTFRWNFENQQDMVMTFNENDIWYPSMRLINVNSRKLDADLYPNRGMIVVFHYGSAYYTVTKTTETRCAIDATYYPFDEQVCDVDVSVSIDRTRASNAINISNMGNIFNTKNSDNVWKFTKFKIKTATDIEGQRFIFRLYLKRKPTWAIVNLIVPIFVLVSMTPLVFLLPRDGGERIGLSLTILLAVSVYMTLVSDYLPMSSDPLPVLTVVLFVWYASNTTVVLLVIFNSRIFKLHESRNVPMTLERFVHRTRKIFCQSPLYQQTLRPCLQNSNEISLDDRQTVSEVVEHEQNDKDGDAVGGRANRPEPNKKSAMVKWSHVSSAIDKWLFLIIYAAKVVFAICVFQKMRFGQVDIDPELGLGQPRHDPWDYDSGP